MSTDPSADPVPRQAGPDEGRLAEARLRFLTSETTELDEVREAILTSWWRSRRSQVRADSLEVPYDEDRDFEASWIHRAGPLLSQLREQLDGQPVSLILTDPSGAVLSQHTGDAELGRHLERVHLAPGFSYGEQFVGTNGIGTALQDGRPRHVFGHEHYAEHLENLACAGVPVHHPISGKPVGAVDLTCWRKDASGLLIALARSTALQVRQALLNTASVRELELFHAYLQACRRSGGIVLAVNDDVVMMNDYARQLLDPTDQSVLIGRATQAVREVGRTSLSLDLPSGNAVRVHCRRVDSSTDAARAGGIVRVELVDPDDEHGSARPALPMFLPGAVGSAPLWLRCCSEVDASCGWCEWVALTGEPGVGKHTVAACVHQRRRPTARLRTFDAATGEPGWVRTFRQELAEDPPAALVLRNIDHLDAATADELTTVLSEVAGRPESPWVAVTLSPGSGAEPELAPLLELFARTVEVPPLRYRIEDLHQFVPFFLNKLCQSGQLTCSAGAMKLLARASWPGNVAELHRLLKHVARNRRRRGAIQPDDLPPEYQAVSRRALNQMESIERDAIVEALRDADGNKARAAKMLGLSRATIYRKLHEYGIVPPERSR